MKTKKDASFGIIPVFKKENGYFLFCLIQHQGEHYGFPKGHPNPGESEEETAKRELEEETGILNVELVYDISFNQQYIFEKDGIVYDKSVKYFLGFVNDINTRIPKEFENEISDLKWLSYEEALEIITFDNAKDILKQTFNFLVNKA